MATIVATAGVSRRTFYENFSNRETCYLALADEINVNLVAVLASVFTEFPAPGLSERVLRTIELYVEVVSAAGVARSVHRELTALGEPGLAMHHTMFARFAEALIGDFHSGSEDLGSSRPHDRVVRRRRLQ